MNIAIFRQQAAKKNRDHNIDPLQVVKYLIKSGADLFVRNAAGRTPREEAEATLDRVDSDELVATVAFLCDEERRRAVRQQQVPILETRCKSDMRRDVKELLTHKVNFLAQYRARKLGLILMRCNTRRDVKELLTHKVNFLA
jgi:hypothetical protein